MYTAQYQLYHSCYVLTIAADQKEKPRASRVLYTHSEESREHLQIRYTRHIPNRTILLLGSPEISSHAFRVAVAITKLHGHRIIVVCTPRAYSESAVQWYKRCRHAAPPSAPERRLVRMVSPHSPEPSFLHLPQVLHLELVVEQVEGPSDRPALCEEELELLEHLALDVVLAQARACREGGARQTRARAGSGEGKRVSEGRAKPRAWRAELGRVAASGLRGRVAASGGHFVPRQASIWGSDGICVATRSKVLRRIHAWKGLMHTS